MENIFVPYELSKQLMKYGFAEKCVAFYGREFPELSFDNIKVKDLSIYGGDFSCSAPTWMQLIEWFREKHDIIIQINADCSQLDFKYGFDYWIWWRGKGVELWSEQTSTPQNCPAGEWSHSDYYECLKDAIIKSFELIN